MAHYCVAEQSGLGPLIQITVFMCSINYLFCIIIFRLNCSLGLLFFFFFIGKNINVIKYRESSISGSDLPTA